METIHNGIYRADYKDTARGPLLVITRNRGKGGAYIEGNDAKEWADHIRTAIDKSEANALCKAIVGN